MSVWVLFINPFVKVLEYIGTCNISDINIINKWILVHLLIKWIHTFFFSIKQWSVIKEKNFLGRESKVMKNALFELSWRVVNGQMKVESAINILEDLCVSEVINFTIFRIGENEGTVNFLFTLVLNSCIPSLFKSC